MLLLGY